LQLGGNQADGSRTVHHFSDRAATGHLADILAEIANRYAAIDRNLSFVGLLLACDHPEQRGLAGAVRPDKADLLAFLEHCGGFDEEDMVAELLADVIEADHGHARKEKSSRPLLSYLQRQGKRVLRP